MEYIWKWERGKVSTLKSSKFTKFERVSVKSGIQSLKELINALQQSWWLSFLDCLVDRIEMEEQDRREEDEEDEGKWQSSKCH